MSSTNESERDMEDVLDLGRVVRWRLETMHRLLADSIELPVKIKETWDRVVALPWPAFVEAFEELLLDPDGYIRIRAEWILRVFTSRPSISTLVKALPSSEPQYLRNLAVEGLAALEPSDAVEVLPALCKLLAEEQDETILFAAISSIKRYGWDIASLAVPAFGQALKQQSAEIRREACSALGWLGIQARGLVRKLLQVAIQDIDPSVRQEAARALVSVDPEGNALVETDTDESQRARFMAVLGTLGEVGRPLRLLLFEAWRPVDENGDASLTDSRGNAGTGGLGSEGQLPGDPDLHRSTRRKLTKRLTQSKTKAVAVLEIERWNDLGIGIYEDRNYYAYRTRPAFGDMVALKDAVILPLKGPNRWPKVLNLLAQSEDGRRARKTELITELGYRKRYGLPLSKLDYDLHIHANNLSKAGKALVAAMADLGRELKQLVRADEDALIFNGQADSEFYIAAFVTGLLTKDAGRSIRFTHPKNSPRWLAIANHRPRLPSRDKRCSSLIAALPWASGDLPRNLPASHRRSPLASAPL